MQLLIVHHDPEIGDQLARMVEDYTGHECVLVATEADAHAWARGRSECRLLLTQLDAPGMDGLSVGAALSDVFPGLQVLFFPPYPTADVRLEFAETKVFPEPIDGERLLAAVARAESASLGAPDLFHPADILQMCCLSKRNGAVQMVHGRKSGIVFLRGGQIVHAETTAGRGRDALADMVSWNIIEFAYDKTVRPPAETISQLWDEVLVEVVTEHREAKSSGRRRFGG